MKQDTTSNRSGQKAACRIEDCSRPQHARGWCKMHYYRWRRTGTTRESTPSRVELQCAECGSRFERKRSEVSKGSNYCSVACHNLGKRGKPHNWRSTGIGPIAMTCPICGDTFTRYASQVRARGARWCSYACQTEGRKNHRSATCKQCGQHFTVQPRAEQDARRGKFCSRGCFDAFRKEDRSKTITQVCGQCGASFDRPAAWVRKGSRNRYCSKGCASAARHRGASLPRRGAVWKRLAEEIRERDGQVCVRCGDPEPSAKSLNVDHIMPARLFLDRPDIADRPENLASLCTACHAIKTHRYEPRILRGDFLAIEEFYDAPARERTVILLNLPKHAKAAGLLRPDLP